MGFSVFSRTRFLRTTAIASSFAVLGSLLLWTGPAAADTSPTAGLPETVSTDSLPTAQINGVVWDQVIVGNTVFAGGSFTTARPAGAAAGTSTVPRSNLLSYNLTTGVLTSWAPTLNGQVRALDVSPDGTRLYVVGAFTTVNGATRNRIVAFDVATGAVISSFGASANGQVFAVTASASTVYFAGQFTQAGGVSRPGQAAAVSASTGATLPWAPVIAGGRAFAMEVSPDNSKVVLAGNFTTLNGSGNPGYGMGAVNTSTGASVTWTIGTIIKNAGPDAAIYNLDSDATSVYGTGYTFGAGGNLEGSWRAGWASGAFEWVQDCRGDEYSVAAAGNVVYVAGHPHNCGTVGGFPQTEPWTWHRGVAFTKDALDTQATGVFAGRPQPTALQFFPTINSGTFTGQFQGPWSVAANANYVVYAGEFTQVNGVNQQGLSRFAVKSIAPNKDAPQENGASWPLTAASYATGTVRLSWPANQDRDNETLTYRVIRNGNTGAPVYTTTAPSAFWNRPTLTYVDSGLTAGASYTYRVSATDPFGNVAYTSTITATAGTSGTLSNYARAVFSNSPTYYFRLNESSGAAVNLAGPTANTTANGDVIQTTNATAGTGMTRGQAGAISGDSNTSMYFNNNTSSRIYTTAQTWGDDSVSVEAWFKTSTSSGKIVGFGTSSSSSNSGSADRHLYLNGGRVVWGINDGNRRTIQSGTGMNNNAWHHVVGTVNASGMSLYVDGALVATRTTTTKAGRYWGNWHIGGDSTWAGNQNFTGNIDEVAIYKVPLTAAQVLAHYNAGKNGTAPPTGNTPPTASFTTSTSGLTASVNGSGSTDTGGSIASYAWNFGDGSTGTGVTASRTYAAAGTYTVTLTVTDNQGATNSTTRSVTVGTVTPPPVGGAVAQDTFERTVTAGWGTATTGGAWSATANSSYVVNSGSAAAIHTTGTTRRALLDAVSATSTNSVVDVTLDKAATGGGVYAGAVGRQVGSSYYRGRIRFNAGGSVGIQVLNGPSTILGNATVAGLTYSPGQTLRLRVETTGTNPTTIRARVWVAGTTEPTTWQVTATDSTAALQTAGSVGLESYLSGSATNAPLTVRYDNYSVTSGTAAPGNTPPTASFTTSTSGLTASVNGSGSTDTGGSIASYAWNFGDGSTGTGVTASRTYAAAGTYTVTLTVTDNQGATNSTTRSVTVGTVTPPPVGGAVAQDTFERTVTAGWGTATTGGAWSATANSSYVVNSGSAAAIHTTGTTRRGILTGVSATSTSSLVDVTLDKAATGGGVYAGAVGRQVGSLYYRGRIRFYAGGAVGIQVLNGASTVLSDATVAGLTYSPGQTLRLRVETTGTNPTTIRARVWVAGTTEPTTWQVTATDSTAALQTAGSVGLESYLSGSATNAPLTVRYDNYTVTAP